jgi:hypothetical protein
MASLLQVINLLLEVVKVQYSLLALLFTLLVLKPLSGKSSDKSIDKPYRKLMVDKLPVIDIPQMLDYRKLL